MGGIDPGLRTSADGLVTATVASVSRELAELRGPRSAAPRLPLVVIIALGLAVMSTTRPMFDRALAWYRLVRVWATLRFDDR